MDKKIEIENLKDDDAVLISDLADQGVEFMEQGKKAQADGIIIRLDQIRVSAKNRNLHNLIDLCSKEIKRIQEI